MDQNQTIIAAFEMTEGVGTRVRRAFPTALLMSYDPFVLFDEFFVSQSTGFPEHPHRGFEALTYMLSGTFRHKDILGNDSEVGAGGVQRFTAGKGIVHSEMPGLGGHICRGLQLWINLPRRLKHIEPSYQRVSSEKIPQESFDGGRVRTIIGKNSPVKVLTSSSYLDLRLESQVTYELPLFSEWNSLIYVYNGKIEISGQRLGQGHVIFLGQQHKKPRVTALEASGFVFLAGKPHGEAIYHNGPYVD
ncbi:MAG: pirin family protein [Chitinispirillales bacterium]|jgi:redox-sensitive bicupin YhaK (pirin superfamily)|nr:pirin family protein [Chitinispirillales bacterium]